MPTPQHPDLDKIVMKWEGSTHNRRPYSKPRIYAVASLQILAILTAFSLIVASLILFTQDLKLHLLYLPYLSISTLQLLPLLNVELLLLAIICGVFIYAILTLLLKYSSHNKYTKIYHMSTLGLLVGFVMFTILLPTSTVSSEVYSYRSDYELSYLKSQSNKYYGSLDDFQAIPNSSNYRIVVSNNFSKDDFIMIQPAFIPPKGSLMWLEYTSTNNDQILTDMGLIKS